MLDALVGALNKDKSTLSEPPGFRLYPYRGVPREYFHLYLAEVCYRFNHRDENLKPLLLKLLKQTSIQELRPTLVRKA